VPHPFPDMTVDEFVSILRSATPDDNPFDRTPDAIREPMGAPCADLFHAVAAFVDAARASDFGYAQARSFLADLVHTFPVPMEQTSDGQAAIRDLLAGLEDPERIPTAEEAAPTSSAALTVADLEALPVGSVVEDASGDRYVRESSVGGGERVWRFHPRSTGEPLGLHRSRTIAAFGPITLVTRGGEDPTPTATPDMGLDEMLEALQAIAALREIAEKLGIDPETGERK